MKIRVWPFVLVSLGLWFLTLITIGYLVIGIFIKIGHSILREVGAPEGLDPPTTSDVFMDFYDVITWPWYVSIVGFRRSFVLMGGGLFCISTMLGMFYYLGTSATVPESVSERYKAIAMNSDHSLPLQIKSEINKRINEGFEYSDLLWARNEVRKSCGIKVEHTNSSNKFLRTTTMGMMSILPPFAQTLMAIEDIGDSMTCT
jgi:hypothetical protein